MGRKKVKINPKSGERLSLLLKEHGMTQKELANALGYTTQQISRISTGKERLTEDFAKRVTSLLSSESVRPEWLTGEDDFKTFKDQIQSIAHYQIELEDIIQRLISLHGYEVTVERQFTVDRKATEEEQLEENKKALSEWNWSSCHLRYEPGISDEAVLRLIHATYPENIIAIKSPLGVKIGVELCEYKRILQAINDYIEMQLSHLFSSKYSMLIDKGIKCVEKEDWRGSSNG